MRHYTELSIHLVFLAGFISCNTIDKCQIKKNVLRLEHRALTLTQFINNTDSCNKAILFLDSATTLDKNCYTCYSNKLVFQNALKRYDDAIFTINQCIRIEPTSYDLYLRGGALYEKVGDTISSEKYFQDALRHCLAKIDSYKDKTFKQQGDFDWFVIRIDQAIILKLLRDDSKANTLLEKLNDIPMTYFQDTSILKKSILYFANSDRKKILDSTFK